MKKEAVIGRWPTTALAFLSFPEPHPKQVKALPPPGAIPTPGAVPFVAPVAPVEPPADVGPVQVLKQEEIVVPDVKEKKKGLPVWAWGLILGGGGLVVGGALVGIGVAVSRRG
jgi:hypothetical protein